MYSFCRTFCLCRGDKESVFVTLTGIKSAEKIELTPQGMQLSEPADPQADVVALLGGLSMPKSNVTVEEVNEMISQIEERR